MGEQTREIIKDFIVSLLIVICIGIIVSMVFYDDIALGKVIPEAEGYTLTAEMKNELEYSELDGTEEIIINYYIDASDLKKYEKTNEYVKGKNNPFAAIGDTESEDNTNTDENTSSNIVINNNNNSNNNSNDNNNNENNGFYEDDGTK